MTVIHQYMYIHVHCQGFSFSGGGGGNIPSYPPQVGFDQLNLLAAD